MKRQVNNVNWKPCWRIIPDKYNPISIYEDTTDPEDLEYVIELEARTNQKILDQIGQISLVPIEDRISGPGTSFIMTSFTHIRPDDNGSRFSDGSYGVFYAAKEMGTAIKETKYHQEILYRNTDAPAMPIAMQVLRVDLDGDLHDIRGMKEELSEVYSSGSYSESQKLAIKLRKGNSQGIVYDSVRDETGECVAVLKPALLSNCCKAKNLLYIWDGKKITHELEVIQRVS